MTPEYEAIAAFYGDRRAKRSGVRLMQHIDEGLMLLREWDATDLAKRAFCLHPIVQNDEDVDVTWSDAYPLACEYRDRANAFLCRPETDYITRYRQLKDVVGTMSRDCRDMLLADKLQNWKDFRLYHAETHPRKGMLGGYFPLWVHYLLSELWWAGSLLHPDFTRKGFSRDGLR